MPKNNIQQTKEVLKIFIPQLEYYLNSGSDPQFLIAFLQSLALLRRADTTDYANEIKRLVNRNSEKYKVLIQNPQNKVFVRELSTLDFNNPTIPPDNLIAVFRSTLEQSSTLANVLPSLEDSEKIKYQRLRAQEELEKKIQLQESLDKQKWSSVEKRLQSSRRREKHKEKGKFTYQKKRSLFERVIKDPINNTLEAISNTKIAKRLSSIKTGKPNKWNSYTPNPTIQFSIQTANIIPSIGKAIVHISAGSRTGFLFALPMVFINPAGVLLAFSAGTAIGAIRSSANEAFENTNIRTFNPNSIFSNSATLTPLAKASIKSALNNPKNWNVRVNDIANPAVREFVAKEGITTNARIDAQKVRQKYKFDRTLRHVLNSIETGAQGLLAGVLLTGGNIPLSLAVAVGATTVKYIAEQQQEKSFEKFAEAKSYLLSFPGMNLASNPKLSAEELRIQKRRETKEFLKKMPMPAAWLVNGLDSVTVAVGLPSPIGFLASLSKRWEKLPFILKAAPVIAPLIYVMGGPLFGYQLALGRLLFSIAIGLGASAAGMLTRMGEQIRFNRRFRKEKNSADFFLGTAGFVQGVDGSLLGGFIRRSLPWFGALGGVMGIVGVFRFAQAAWDLLNHGIKKLGDYAKLTGLVIMFLMSASVFKRAYDDMMVQAPRPISEEAQRRATNTLREKQFVVAESSYALPPIVYECQSSHSSTTFTSPEQITITDQILLVNENGEQTNTLKAEVAGQKFIYKDLRSVGPNVKISKELEQGKLIGGCSAEVVASNI